MSIPKSDIDRLTTYWSETTKYISFLLHSNYQLDCNWSSL